MQGFADRLDFVMGVTRTTNSSLARALAFDASYICRIRNGKRGLPRSQPFAEPAAVYLASRTSGARERRALEEEIGHPWPVDKREAAELLAGWLLTGRPPAHRDGALAVSRAIAALGASVPDGPSATAGNLQPAPGNARDLRLPASTSQSPQVSFHYGNDGKREAILAFLGRLVAEEEPRELLLHSDEDMSWLYEDDGFAREWAALLLRAIEAGCRIRVVHAISRDANEMWEAVGKWMPLYMTGAVEPYHYPRLRDGVYRRTLFVACGHSAIVAASVGAASTNGLNMLISDPDAVAAYEREFTSYLALCRPLMKVAFPEAPHELADIVAAFAEGKGELCAVSEGEQLICAWADGPALVANAGAMPATNAKAPLAVNAETAAATSTKAPRVTFSIDEPRMAAAVWGYLQSLPDNAVRSNEDARDLINNLAKALKRA